MAKFTKKTNYICVEIVLKTNHTCDKFIKWYEKQDNYVHKLECETHRWYVYFQPSGNKNPDKTIRRLCEEIKSLPQEIKDEWDQAEFKEFNIGYHVGDEPHFYGSNLSAKTISMIRSLDAGIGISLYPAPLSDEDGYPEGFFEQD